MITRKLFSLRALRHLSQLALTLTVLMLAGSSAHAALLVYEPFDYAPTGTPVPLSGQGATNTFGMTGTWSVTFSNGTAPVTVYKQGNLSGVNLSTSATPSGAPNNFVGTVANLPTSGGYIGPVSSASGGTSVTTDHIEVARPLDPSVTATFTSGSTTWFSWVSARAFDLNATSPRFAIGAGSLLEDRGHLAAGQAIGVGGGLQTNALKIFPQVWNNDPSGTFGGNAGTFNNYNVAGIQIGTGAGNTNSISTADSFTWAQDPSLNRQPAPNVIIGKIVWSDSGPDVISVARFLQTDVLTEAAFNSVALSSGTWTTQLNLDQSTFDTISLGGGRYFADELRIGTTFNSAIGVADEVEAVPEPGTLVLAVCGMVGLLVLAAHRCRSVAGQTQSVLAPSEKGVAALVQETRHFLSEITHGQGNSILS